VWRLTTRAHAGRVAQFGWRKPREFGIVDDPQTIQAIAAFAILTLIIVLGAWRLASLRRQARGEPRSGSDDLLAELEAGYEAGHMSEEEYRRIRESLDRQGALPADRWAVTRPPTRREAEPPTAESAEDS
jgi:uncharacterized membrane protein